ncbi:MAG: biopolymer transporter ExbD [Candidatus Omnitrophica bacterium]|jgi:biopolymer transport protein ExbD|nr:biopolymer transporter ExbD [Candidatus Omnitrophota bacterium]
MKIGGRKDYLISLESIVMTDIVMNMFIFFFISFSLLYTFNPNRVQKLDIKLPKAANTSNIENYSQVNISLSNEGMIYLGEDVVNIRTLKEKISLKRRENPGLVVILRADKLVAFKNIVNVLDTLTELGISNLNIATVKE